MKTSTFKRVGGLMILIGAMIAPATMAQVGSTDTSTWTITEPTDVVGTILQPGTYRIAITSGSNNDRRIVRITSPDAMTLHTTVLTVPRPLTEDEETANTMFVYYPATASEARALRTWYPANAPRGIAYDFVYDEERAKALARESETRVVYYRNVEEIDLGTTELQVVTPQARVETWVAPKLTLEPAPRVVETRTLPATAGKTPLIALLGLLLVAAAIVVRFSNR